MRKSYAPRKFGVKAANSKVFQLNFASLPFTVAGKLFCTKILFVRQLVLQLKKLFLVSYERDFMYFSCTFTSLLRHKTAILTQSLLLCKSSDKFSPRCKFLASKNEAILTY